MGLRVALDSPQRLLERALAEPRLLRTPLVRDGGKVAVGYVPDQWQAWIDADKTPPSAGDKHT
jgi:arsenate reductase-like glutaredoxin family protein